MDEKEYILIVDDNLDATALLAMVLKNAGFNTKVFNEGQQALNFIDKCKTEADLPQLILLDLMMPDVSGLDVLRYIKSDAKLPFVPVVVITANFESQSRVASLQYGADDYLVKPVHKVELLARVNSLLRLKHLYDEKTRLLSEVQAAYNQLNTAQSELLDMEKSKAQIEGMIATAAAICHEMSQPLTSGLITLQFIQQTNLEPDPDLSAIEQSLLQARTILDKLRALTRYETKTYLGQERILDLDRSSQSNAKKQTGYIGSDELIG